MIEKSKVHQEKPDFVTQIPEYSDGEILKILKKRNHYQPEAARLAVEEALKRKLIFSEEDLLAKEYRPKPLKKKLFPAIEDNTQRQKISRSISRGLLITGVIPIIFGLLKFNQGNTVEGSLVTSGGVLWMFFAAQTIRKIQPKILRLFFVLLALGGIYLVNVFLQLKSFVFMDVFIVAVVYGLAIYGLLFLIKLYPQKQNRKP